MRRIAFLLALIGLALAAGRSEAASIRQQQAFFAWHIQDLCARAASRKFPDYTPEGNAARDRDIRACEVRHHLPPRADLHDSPVKRIPDSAAE